MPENSFIVTILDPAEFDAATMQEEQIEDGVIAVKGALVENPESAEIQSMYFDAELFDMAAVEQWLSDNNIEYTEIKEPEMAEDSEESAEPEEMADALPGEEEDEEDKLKPPAKKKQGRSVKRIIESKVRETRFTANNKRHELKDVEILRTGIWNGEKYTINDLDEMVKNFNSTREILKPCLKLGHDENQSLLQKDGMPAAGWITDVKRVGNRLLATIKNIPDAVHTLIERKAYGRFSSEVFVNYREKTGKVLKKVLKAVALLGADTPAVGSMTDLIDVYNQNGKSIILNNFREENSMSKQEIAKLTALEQENLSLKAKIDEINQDRLTDKVDRYLDEQLKEGKIVPAQVKYFKALMMNDSHVNKLSYIEGAEEKQLEGTNFDLIKEIINIQGKIVNLSETSKYIKPEKKSDDDILHESVKKYAKENKVTYSQAYDAVISAN